MSRRQMGLGPSWRPEPGAIVVKCSDGHRQVLIANILDRGSTRAVNMKRRGAAHKSGTWYFDVEEPKRPTTMLDLMPVQITWIFLCPLCALRVDLRHQNVNRIFAELAAAGVLEVELVSLAAML